MKRLTALIAVLSLFTFAGIAFAGAVHTHCKHAGDECVTLESSKAGSSLIPEDYLE